jgi:hypothetical protein
MKAVNKTVLPKFTYNRVYIPFNVEIQRKRSSNILQVLTSSIWNSYEQKIAKRQIFSNVPSVKNYKTKLFCLSSHTIKFTYILTLKYKGTPRLQVLTSSIWNSYKQKIAKRQIFSKVPSVKNYKTKLLCLSSHTKTFTYKVCSIK